MGPAQLLHFNGNIRVHYSGIRLNTPGGGYHLDFAFPEGYEGFFTFTVERSLTLGPGSFTAIPGTSMLNLGGGTIRATIPAGQAPPGKAFFRIAVGLAP